MPTKEYYKKNKEYVLLKRKEYYYNNQKEIIEKQKIYVKRRRMTPKGRYEIYREGAIKRNIVFNISLDEFCLYWKKPCGYCGDSIELIGLDRIDNNQGYIKENIIPCCEKCNRMKLMLHGIDFINHCKKISKYNCYSITPKAWQSAVNTL